MKRCFVLPLLMIAILASCANTPKSVSETNSLYQAFSCVVAESGEVYWKAGIDTPEGVIKEFALGDDNTTVKVRITPDNGKAYPYLYPDEPWKLTVAEDAAPAWFTGESAAAAMDALEQWKEVVYTIDLTAFMHPFDPTTVAPHEPSEEDITLFREWISSGGNPRNMIMKSVSGAIGATVANELWNYLNTEFWSDFMHRANVGSVVSKLSGLKNVGAVQEGQFAAYFGSFFADLMTGGGNPNGGGNPGGANQGGNPNGGGNQGGKPNDGGNDDPHGSSNGYEYGAAVMLINHGFLVSSDATTWRLHNAADGSIVYSIAASDIKSNENQAFTVIVSESGKTYWQAGIDSGDKLMTLFGLDSNGGYMKASVVPDNNEAYPYLYPDQPWKLIADEKPVWYNQSHEAAIMAAFEEWKAFAYDFDLDGFLNFFAKLPMNPVKPTAADIQLLKEWAAYKNANAKLGNQAADEN